MFGALKDKLKGFISKLSGEAEEEKKPKQQEKPQEKVEEREETKPKEKPSPAAKKAPSTQPKRAEKKGPKPKVGLVKQIASLATGTIELSERELEPALEELELSLLEADVAFDVVEDIKDVLKKELVGKKISRSKLEEKVRAAISEVVSRDLKEGQDIVELVRNSGKRPFTILFFGINGAGKTSTIAKVANLLKEAGFSVLIAAGDTFRAAAIEQLEEHAKRLGVPFVKGNYGDHPATVAHNALQTAKAKGIDVVLIDTAGRQELNLNLMKELEKISRVANPDLKLYVGESTSGSALYDQVKTYNDIVGIDGVILTKVDLDPKGGSAISVSKVTGAPIYYITTGQGYGDIVRFSKQWLLERLL